MGGFIEGIGQGMQRRTLTGKQEKFCQSIVSGENQSDAYRSAYDSTQMAAKTVNEKASRLMGKDNIGARVEELRAPVVKEVQYDLKAAMDEANLALMMAQAQENPSVMVAAVALRSKLSGLLIEKAAAPLSVLETASTEVLLAMLAEYERRSGRSGMM